MSCGQRETFVKGSGVGNIQQFRKGGEEEKEKHSAHAHSYLGMVLSAFRVGLPTSTQFRCCLTDIPKGLSSR